MHGAKKERHELVDTLAGLPVFAGAARADLEDLAGAGRVVTLPAGWTIMASDTPGDSVYVLLAGETVVRRGTQLLAEVGPGAVVGEAALIDGKLRSATVSAKSPIRVLRIGYDEMTALLGRRPALRPLVFAGYEQRHLPTDG